MKYKDIIGYSKPKKKLIKEQIKSQPKKTKILENNKNFKMNLFYHLLNSQLC